MKKISTLFKKDPNNLSRVINEVNPENEWVIKGEGVPTRKYDGTAAAIINGELYKRYDVKKGKQVPAGAIPCQEPDAITGHWPHWVKCNRNNKEDKYFFEALDLMQTKEDGTYELCGPKVQGNPEKFDRHILVPHGKEVVYINPKIGYSVFENFFNQQDPEDANYVQFNIEGIVFHHPDGRMCKIRKSDFGIKR